MCIYKIYGLVSSEKPENIKYIGLTKQKLNRRLQEHVLESKKGKTKKCNWIRSLKNKNHYPMIILIEDNINKEDIFKKEIEYIKLFKSFGANLKNSTIGGEGIIDKESSIKSGISRQKKIKCYNIETKEISIYNSIKEASKILETHDSKISKSLKTNYFVKRKYIFCYNDIDIKIKLNNISNSRLRTLPINVYDTNNGKITRYLSVHCFCKELKSPNASVYLSIKENRLYKKRYKITFSNYA